MWFRRFAFGLVLSTIMLTAASALAQSKGAQKFEHEAMDASGSIPNVVTINAFATRDTSPFGGTTDSAVINFFDLVTFEFKQCVNSTIDLNVTSNGRATLSFITDQGTNCPSGEEVIVSCETSADSAIFHNVTNGTAKLPIFDQQFTTHGQIYLFNNLTCQLSAFGVALDGTGSANTERDVTTP